MEGFKIAQVVGAPYRRFFVGIVLATVVASVAGFWIFVANMYDAGAQNVSYNIGSEPFRRMKRWIQNPGEPSPEMLIEMGIGAAITVVLTFFHHRFLWFPFHPVGFAVAAGWVMSAAWFSIFVGWVVKRFVLFAGGPKMFRRAIPFFVGLVLGQHVIGGSWTILGMFTDRQVYRFFPYR
jgi:hypothetical protein